MARRRRGGLVFVRPGSGRNVRIRGRPCRGNLETAATLKPGDKGTTKLGAEFGDRLVCVRIRKDPARKKKCRND